MADTPKAPFAWPVGSWRVLKKIIRAWYTAESEGGEWTQRTVAKIANLQPSRVSVNKAFLQAIGIVQPGGVALTEAGKNLGLGLSNDNAKVTEQTLQRIITENSILKQLLSIVRGRGTIDTEGFEAEVVLLTKQGRNTSGFSTGVGVLEDILLESRLVGISDNTFRPLQAQATNELLLPKHEELRQPAQQPEGKIPGLRKIPIPVSASTIWYIEVGENPEANEIDKFIEMQKLIFGVNKPS
jgi:hypothetical protein